MDNNYFHISKFGYFYIFCSTSQNNEDIKKEISKIKKIVERTNNLVASNNALFNSKLLRKEKRLEASLRSIASKKPEILLEFESVYCSEEKNIKVENDPWIIARNIAQSFFDAYQIKKFKKDNIVSQKNNYQARENDIILNLPEQDKKILIQSNNDKDVFAKFLSELKKCKYPKIMRQLNTLDKLSKIKPEETETVEEYQFRIEAVSRYAYCNIDMIFKKGRDYPFRKTFIKILSKIIYIYDVKERKLSELKEYLKKAFYKELINQCHYDEVEFNYGYLIPSDTSTEMIVKVDEDLANEKKRLLEIYNKGCEIKFDRPFTNNIQARKVDIINSFFDKRFECNLNHESTKKDFVTTILDLCELADEITDDLFKKVLFDAHDSSNLAQIQSYEKNEAFRTLYELYSPTEKLENYEKVKNKFENVFKTLTNSKRDSIYKKVYEEKQNLHMSINELVPSKETIMNNLLIRETKFIDSHAVEEFKYKALNYGKYLNYDLEVVARDIDVDELPVIYKKLKRNIMYTNFVEEIKPGEDREKKYKEARIIQKKTLAVLQEMIAKTILNKNYEREYDISYDSYQNILNSIYENVLHEERMFYSYDDFYNEYEPLERNYQEKKKVWDENSYFIKALYFVISQKES